jgi:hypothetical protein
MPQEGWKGAYSTWVGGIAFDSVVYAALEAGGDTGMIPMPATKGLFGESPA